MKYLRYSVKISGSNIKINPYKMLSTKNELKLFKIVNTFFLTKNYKVMTNRSNNLQ